MLHHWLFDCPAYRSLKPGPRAVLWELIRRHNGSNNGRIACGARDMARAVQVADRQTIAEYERELEAKGFIKAVRRGGFSVKVSDRRVTEWALTWEKIGDELPTKEFARWRPKEIDGTEKPSMKDSKSVPPASGDIHDYSNVREFPSDKVRRTAAARAG
jgi:hypothetical protein